MLQANSIANIGDLQRLNDELRKAAQVSGQTGTGFDATPGHLAPLVPQSIEDMLSSATYSMASIVLFQRMSKIFATNPLHEYNVVNSHGDGFDPFIAEGGGGTTDFPESFASYERKTVRVKFLAERRFVTDLATTVGLVGDNRSAIAEETERGTLSLMGKNEKALFHGDEDVNPLAFDGVLKQVERGDLHSGGNLVGGVGKTFTNFQTDMAGQPIAADLLQDALSDIYGSPRFGQVDTIYMDPRIHSKLVQDTVSQGRHDQLHMTGDRAFAFGANALSVMAPYGNVPIIPAPFMARDDVMPTAAVGETIGVPVLTKEANVANQVALDGLVGGAGAVTSDWAAADDGDYQYKVIAVTAKGMSAPSAAVTSTIDVAGAVNIATHLTATGSAGPDANILRWRVYRTEKGGSTFTFLGEARSDTAGNVGNLKFVDINRVRTKTGSILFASHDPRIMQYVRLLDLLRRPLASTASITPFLLMLFGSPVVKVPSKMHVLRNVAL